MATVIAYKVFDGTNWVELALKSAIPTNTNQLTNGAGFITSSALSGYATETWVGNNYLGKTAKAADSSKLNGQSASYYQIALPTTSTAGKVLKSTSVAGTVEWGDDNNANYYPSRSYSSGLQISTSSGIANTCALFVPDATTSQKGVLALTDTNLNTMINQLSTGSSDPTDNDYYISQYVGGGTTTVTYHRRPVSKLYNYMKGKMDSVYQAKLTAQTAYSAKGSATKVPQITTNALGQVTSITEVTITQPTVNNGVLTIKAGGTSKGTFSANQSGNTEINITASDLGLGDALHFIGVSTTAITDGGTQNPTISGYSGTAKATGNVVLYDGKEFVWTGSAWEQLGDESSWALKTVSISAGTGLTGGGTLAADRTISLADNYGDTKNPYASKTANYVLAAPNGSNGAPSFRALVAADIPSLNASKITAGTFADARIASASTWNAKYSKPSGGIPASDLAEKYVRYDTNAQGLTNTQKSNARTNIGAGTVTSVKVGTTSYNPTSGVVSLPAYPTKSSWNYDDTYLKLTGGTLSGTLIVNTIQTTQVGDLSISTPGDGTIFAASNMEITADGGAMTMYSDGVFSINSGTQVDIKGGLLNVIDDNGNEFSQMSMKPYHQAIALSYDDGGDSQSCDWIFPEYSDGDEYTFASREWIENGFTTDHVYVGYDGNDSSGHGSISFDGEYSYLSIYGGSTSNNGGGIDIYGNTVNIGSNYNAINLIPASKVYVNGILDAQQIGIFSGTEGEQTSYQLEMRAGRMYFTLPYYTENYDVKAQLLLESSYSTLMMKNTQGDILVYSAEGDSTNLVKYKHHITLHTSNVIMKFEVTTTTRATITTFAALCEAVETEHFNIVGGYHNTAAKSRKATGVDSSGNHIMGVYASYTNASSYHMYYVKATWSSSSYNTASVTNGSVSITDVVEVI